MPSGASVSWFQVLLQAIMLSRFSPERVHYACAMTKVTVMLVLERYLRASLPRVVLPLSVSLELRAVEVNLPQVARGVPPGFIVEVRGHGLAALSASRHCLGPHGRAELDHRHETVPAAAIPLLRAWVRARSE